MSAPREIVKSARESDSRPSPERRRKKLRKDDILAEATRLFAERGYEGASMGDLADRVGLRKASLFHHFPSKDALYATVLEQLLDGIKASMLATLQGDGSYEERVARVSDALTDQFAGHPHAARLLVREAMDWGPVMRDRLAEIVVDVMKAALEFDRAGQRAGAFEPDLDMAHVVITYMGIYAMPFAVGEVVERFIGTSPFDPAFVEERKRAVRDQIRRMMLVKK